MGRVNSNDLLPEDLEQRDERLDKEELLAAVRAARGEAFVEEHRELILLDARRMGLI